MMILIMLTPLARIVPLGGKLVGRVKRNDCAWCPLEAPEHGLGILVFLTCVCVGHVCAGYGYDYGYEGSL